MPERRPGDLTVAENRVDGEVVFQLRGDMDIATAPGIAVRVRDGIRRGDRRFRIDLRDVEFIDSTGIASLVHCHRAVTRVDGELHVECGTDGEVRRMMELTGMDRLFCG